MTERLSIHICTSNRPSELYGLLVSLRNQTFKDWDLLIVDDTNPPILNIKFINDILTRIRLEKHGFKYLRTPIRRGVCYARNFAIKNDFWNEWCVRIDDDSILDENYLEKLVKMIEINGEGIGAVGGIVPVLGAPEFIRDSNKITIFNRITFREDDIFVADDGGFSYYPDAILPAHHLRSSFAFRKSVAKKVGYFPEWTGFTGWREETIFCMKLTWAGYKMFVDTSARCWHAQAPYGGVRTPDYAKQLSILEETFKTWAKNTKESQGDVFNI